MPAFAEVLYNPTRAIVAKLNSDNTFGTPQEIDYIQKLDFDFGADTDTIKSAGLIVEKLSIATEVTGNIGMAAMNFAAMSILMGDTPPSVYGTTPNQYQYLDITLGGSGNPYFGLVVVYAATLGGNVIVGFPKAMLDKKAGFTMDQNKFRLGEAAWGAVAPSTTLRRCARVMKNETATSTGGVTLSSAWFASFFSGYF